MHLPSRSPMGTVFHKYVGTVRAREGIMRCVCPGKTWLAAAVGWLALAGPVGAQFRNGSWGPVTQGMGQALQQRNEATEDAGRAAR